MKVLIIGSDNMRIADLTPAIANAWASEKINASSIVTDDTLAGGVVAEYAAANETPCVRVYQLGDTYGALAKARVEAQMFIGADAVIVIWDAACKRTSERIVKAHTLTIPMYIYRANIPAVGKLPRYTIQQWREELALEKANARKGIDL